MVYLGRSKVRDMYYGAKPELFRLAHNLRINPTNAEKILWKKLKIFRKEGYTFRRQHPIDIFIADFYCHNLKLVIEVDGEFHSDKQVQEHDDNRSGELEKYGIIVIRFTNEYIICNEEKIISVIRKKIAELASPALLGAGDGRG